MKKSKTYTIKEIRNNPPSFVTDKTVWEHVLETHNFSNPSKIVGKDFLGLSVHFRNALKRYSPIVRTISNQTKSKTFNKGVTMNKNTKLFKNAQTAVTRRSVEIKKLMQKRLKLKNPKRKSEINKILVSKKSELKDCQKTLEIRRRALGRNNIIRLRIAA